MLVPHPPLPIYLADLDSHLKQDDPESVVATLGQHIQTFPEHSELTTEKRALLSQALERLERIEREHGSTEKSLVVGLMALGKLGRFDEALRRGRKAFQESPTWPTAIAAGNAFRRAGDMTSAVEMFMAAANLDAKDVTALLEVGDIQLESGRTAEALAAYETALSRQKSQAWAVPSAWYCRFVLTGEKKWRTKLKAAAKAPADECGVDGFLAVFTGGYSKEEKRSRAQYLLQKLDAAMV